MSEKQYSEVPQAEEIVKNLCKKYADVLWAVKPDTIVVLGIENKERSKKNKTLAKIIPIKGVEKVIMSLNKINTQYAIQIYWDDWHNWSENVKQWIIFHELLHVAFDEGKTVKHDIMDFRLLVDVVGVDWFKKNDKLPDLLKDDVKFNLDLRPAVEEAKEDGEGEEDGDEEK